MTAAIWLMAFVSVVGGIATAAPSAVAATDPVVMAAGDIACPPGSTRGTKCRDDLTAAKLDAATHVLTVGDNQYLCGALADFRAAYDKTWGQVLTRLSARTTTAAEAAPPLAPPATSRTSPTGHNGEAARRRARAGTATTSATAGT